MRRDVEQTVTFANNVAPFQDDWLGVCANHSHMPAAYGQTTQQRTEEWDRVAASGVKVVSTWYDESLAMPSYPSGTPDWTSDDMVGFYAFLQAMKDRDVKVMIKMAWHFPQNVGALSGAAPITPTAPQEAIFAAWVSESFNQFLNVRDFDNVIGAFYFTEPIPSGIGTIPGAYASIQEYFAHVVDVATAKIIADDASRTPIRPRVILIGAQEQTTATPTAMDYLAANDTALDALSAHSYVLSPAFGPLGLAGNLDRTYAQNVALFSAWVATCDPRRLWVDEGGNVIGGDSDSSGYRETADWGWRWVMQFLAHMHAGVQATFPWSLSDQPILGHPVTGPVLTYGTWHWAPGGSDAYKASWSAMSMFANLTGGGFGTELYGSVNGTSTLRGTGVFIPEGARHVTGALGEYSFVLYNESALPVKTQVKFADRLATYPSTPFGRTFYRYVYSAEQVPADADLPVWDASYPNIRRFIPANVVPGRSVVIYSTINLAAPTAVNISVNALASTDSTGVGDCANVGDGNRSNVAGTGNGWRKANDSSHYVELEWPAAVTIGRLELAFVAGTPGVIWPDYTTSSMGTACADYGVEYWNGSAFTAFSTPVAVTGNAAPNRTHTFTPVSTTKIRLTVTSAAATGQVNQMGAYAA
jgi:hypothetical protein